MLVLTWACPRSSTLSRKSRLPRTATSSGGAMYWARCLKNSCMTTNEMFDIAINM